MRKLLGLLICASLVAVLSLGSTGCTKKEEPKKPPVGKAGGSADKKPVDIPADGDKKPAADDKKPAADDKKPAADDKKPAADDKKPAADGKKPVADDKKPAADDKKPAADGKKPAADDKKPAADDKKPAADDKKPAADDKKPAADKKPADKESFLNREESPFTYAQLTAMQQPRVELALAPRYVRFSL